MAEKDDVNTPIVAVVGFLGTLGVFIIITLLMVVYYHMAATEDAVKDYNLPYNQIHTLNDQQRGQLADYRLLDAKTKTVAIPIDRAMKLVVADEQAQQTMPPAAKPAGAEN